MDEIWKDIPRYEGRYQASNMGRIKSLARIIESKNQFGPFSWECKENILRPGNCRGGYLVVALDGRTRTVHRIVMETFIGPRPDRMDILHGNGNPKDNRLLNLSYGKRSENIRDIYKQGKSFKKFTTEDVSYIRFGLFCGMRCKELAKQYGVGHQAISKIKQGERFAWLK